MRVEMSVHSVLITARLGHRDLPGEKCPQHILGIKERSNGITKSI